jgi:hypothetical protein
MKLTYDLDLTLHVGYADIETLKDMAQLFQAMLVGEESIIKPILSRTRNKYNSEIIQEYYTSFFNDIIDSIDTLYDVASEGNPDEEQRRVLGLHEGD